MRGANRRHEQQSEDPRSPSLLGLGLVGLVRVPAPLELAVAPLTRNGYSPCRPLADANNALRCRQLKQPQSADVKEGPLNQPEKPKTSPVPARGQE